MNSPRKPMHASAAPTPPDQAYGLRRLFAQGGVRLVPLVSNPHVAFSGALLERLCSAFADEGAKTLLVDACERAPAPDELSVMGLAECIETLSPELSYLAARTLPLRHVDAQGSTAPFLQAIVEAAPRADVVLVHAAASELSRMFARQTITSYPRPLLIADDHPASVTHAYAAMKLLALRARMSVFGLVLGAAPHSPRAERIAEQLSSCADNFLGAVLDGWALIDPACRPTEPLPPALRRLVRGVLRTAPGAGPSRSARAAPIGDLLPALN
jgi:flagellar biosynthesis protein FlhG